MTDPIMYKGTPVTYELLVSKALEAGDVVADLLETIAENADNDEMVSHCQWLTGAILAGGQIFATLAAAAVEKEGLDALNERVPARSKVSPIRKDVPLGPFGGATQ